MGAEQSNNNNRNNQQTPQMSQAEVKRLLEAQRLQYEKKCQEMMDKAAAQNSLNTTNQSLERERAPYQYTKNDLLNVAREADAHRPLYPNLNEAASCSSANTHSFNFQQNPFQQPQNGNPFRQSQDFVFVDGFGQRFRHAPTAPTAPPAPLMSVPAPRPTRPRSVSRQRNVPKERDILDCPTCESRYGPKIFQCNSGHSSCSNCKFAGRPCGICRRSLTNMRNFEMENQISQMKVPCTHTSDGCKLYIKMADMDIHVKECPFKEQQCPLASVFGNCRWRGKLNQISKHFASDHPSQRQTNVDSEMLLTNISNNSRELHLIVLGVFNFVFHLRVSESHRSIFMTVQLIGTKMSAARWVYEIHVYNKSDNRRKYVFTDNCSSSSEDVEEIFRENNCAVLPYSYASSFVNNDALTYKLFLKKTDEGRKDFGKNQRGKDNSPAPKEDKREWRKSNETDSQQRGNIARQWENSKRR